jgi:hypothetical protein
VRKLMSVVALAVAALLLSAAPAAAEPKSARVLYDTFSDSGSCWDTAYFLMDSGQAPSNSAVCFTSLDSNLSTVYDLYVTYPG